MYQLYVELGRAWQQAGGGVFDAYQLSGVGSQYGFWGMIPNISVAGSPKYDGLLAAFYPTADANTDGSVDFADFQIVQADYGMYNAHWVQGDFNQDGLVNWTDLNILRQNIDPSGFTLSQFAQQALFQPLTTVDTPYCRAIPASLTSMGMTWPSRLLFSWSKSWSMVNPAL